MIRTGVLASTAITRDVEQDLEQSKPSDPSDNLPR